MPTLRNPRREAFAQARAGGALLDDAYEAAGFAPGNRHASRLAGRPEVARRIDELLAARDDAREAGVHAVIGALLRLAEAASAPGGAAALGEACLALVQARKLMGEARGARDGGPIR
ncbi:MAG: hypothetical protein JWO83_1911 [Caulobacteraceae bacterium]|nr:hypothetical protein [Caulobacteraceae bacterium]